MLSDYIVNREDMLRLLDFLLLHLLDFHSVAAVAAVALSPHSVG